MIFINFEHDIRQSRRSFPTKNTENGLKIAFAGPARPGASGLPPSRY